MPPKTALVVSSKRRPTLLETLERVRVEGGQVQLDFVNDLQTRARDLRSFRWQAPSTQSRQDRHLYLYLETVRTLASLDDDMPHAAIHSHAFPQDHEKLYEYLETYLVLCFKTTKPRSKYGAAEIAWGTLTKFRLSMLFWVPRIYAQLKRPAPTNSAIFNHMTTTMRGLHVQDRTTTVPIFATQKTHLGLTEIRQLIESDMMRTACIENAEQHHLAWCLGRYLALRPGSIGAEGYTGPGNTRHKPHLVWRDVKLQRDPTGKGRFTAVITINYWKHTLNADANQNQSGPKTFTLVSPPNPDQLIFSVPHRLLVIALRRGLLVDYDNIDDLIDGDRFNITIRDDQLDEPILYASAPRGLTLDRSKPLNATSLTDYIRQRGRALGYPFPITFYSIRRRTATDLSIAYGKDLAREVMGHSVESRTLETSYLDLRQGFNATAAGLGMNLGAFGQDPTIAGSSSLSANTLDPIRLLRTQGEALNVVTQQLMAVDPDNSAIGSDDYKNYRRRIRDQAYRILVNTHSRIQAREDTLESTSNRMLLAQATLFHDEVMRYARDPELAASLTAAPGENLLDHAEKQLSNPPAVPDEDEDEDEDPDSVFVPEHENEPALEEDILEDDAQDTGVPGGSSSLTQNDIPFEVMANISMTLITKNTLSTHEFWETRNKTCPACNEDPTMSQEDKEKQYRSPAVLKSHMSSNVHSGLEMVKRKLDINAASVQPKRYYCLYSCGQNWARRRDCIKHMEQSSEATDGAEHDSLKASDGWYDPGFVGTGSTQYQQELARNRKRLIMHVGLEFDEIPQLQASTPHPTNPHIRLGAFPPYNIPSTLEDEVVELDGFVDTRPEWRVALQNNLDSGNVIEYDISAIPQRAIPTRLQRSVSNSEEVPTLLAKKAKKTSRRVSWAPME